MQCQHYVQLLLMCTSFKKEFNVEEEWNQQMNIIIIFLGEEPGRLIGHPARLTAHKPV